MVHDDQAARYREATELTLEQLDWCIEYFRTNRMTKLSDVLARNRSAIARRLYEDGDVGPRRTQGSPTPPTPSP